MEKQKRPGEEMCHGSSMQKLAKEMSYGVSGKRRPARLEHYADALEEASCN